MKNYPIRKKNILFGIWSILCFFLAGCAPWGAIPLTPVSPISIRVIAHTPTATSPFTQLPTTTSFKPVHAGTQIPADGEQITLQNAERLVEFARWGMGIPQEIAWAPDGSMFGVASTRGVYLYDGINLQLLKTIENGSSFRSISYSPDGEIIATGCEDGKIRLWRAQDGTLLQTLAGHQAAILSLAFSPSGSMLASAGWDDSVYVWRAIEVAEKVETKPLPFGETPKWILETDEHGARKIAFSDNGNKLMVWSRFARVQVWNMIEGIVDRVIPVGETKPGSTSLVTFSANGEYIAVWEGSTIQVYASKNSFIEYELKIETPVECLTFSPDSNYLTAAGDKTIHMWRMSDGVEVQELTYSNPNTYTSLLAISPNSKKLIMLGDKLRLWDLSGISLLEEVQVISGIKRATVSLQAGALAAWNPSLLQVQMWKLNTVTDSVMKTETGVLNGHLIPIQDVAFSPDGYIIVTAADVVRLWNVADQKLLLTLEAPTEDVEQNFRVYDHNTGQTTYVMLNEKTALSSLVYAPDATLLAAGAYDHTIRLWRMPQGIPVATLQWGDAKLDGEMTRVDRVSFSTDGRMLAAVDEKGSLAIWQLPLAPEDNEQAIKTYKKNIQLTQNLQVPNENTQDEQGSSFCELTFAAAGQELIAVRQGRSYRYVIKDGALIEEASSMCGLPAEEGETASDTLRVGDAGLRLGSREDYPILENVIYQQDLHMLVMVRRGKQNVLVQIWQIGVTTLQKLVSSLSEQFALGSTSLDGLIVTDQSAVTCSADGKIKRYRLQDGEVIGDAEVSITEPVNAFVLSTDGLFLAEATEDNKIRIWQLPGEGSMEHPKILRTIQIPGQDETSTRKEIRLNIISVDFSVDGTILAVGMQDNKIYLFNLTDDKLIGILDNPSLPLEIVISPDASHIAVRSTDGVWIWRSSSRKNQDYELLPYIFPGYGVAFSPVDDVVAVESHNLGTKRIDLWSLTEFALQGHGSPFSIIPVVGSFEFSPRGDILAVSGMDISLWSVNDGKLLKRLSNPVPYGDLHFSPDGRLLVVAGWESALFLWGVP